MGHRLSRIYTRTGDAGETGLADGSRVAKTSARVEAMGDVDELNSVLGLLASEPLGDDAAALLQSIQQSLFNLGGELSMPGHSLVTDEEVGELERELDAMNERLEPLKEFILPGGTRAAALAHLARAICRRAERRLVALAANEPDRTPEAGRRYVNRLSDLMFVLARDLNRAAGETDVLWKHERRRRR